MRALALVLALTSAALAQAPKPAAKRPISDAETADLVARTDRLGRSLAALKGRTFGDSVSPADALADAAVARKAATWIVRHGEFFAEDSVSKTVRVLDWGQKRADDLASGKHPWTEAKGGVARGFVSRIDGSVQPYAVYVPEAYDGVTPLRLDVILHGRDATLTEVKFLVAHQDKPMPPGESGLILHVYGRGNNAYRWAGETDVDEAIDAARRNYRVDDRRILLRGFSMGGAGAWHLGLHRPSDWCAVEAGAGFTETRAYAKLKDLADFQEKLLHIYDAVDYAGNARDVPILAYGGEVDPQLQASTNIVETLRARGVTMKADDLLTRAEGLDFLRVVGARTGHSVDPRSAEILKAFRDDHASRGRPERRAAIRFETFTLKYNRDDWVAVEAMGEHYKKATISADLVGDGAEVRAENVDILSVDRDAAETVRIDGKTLPVRSAVKGLLPRVYFRRLESGWEVMDYDQSRALQLNAAGRKRPGLQGPIDDAFSEAFLCVRGTGTAWNGNVSAWSKLRLERFASEWSESLRGDLPIKDDVDVSAEDIERRHLVLFGDPGSNSVLARVIGDLPVKWTKTEFSLGGQSYPSADHAPALIASSPLNRLKYVVLNSGHTFGSADFLGTNALLYPRLGDWAALRLGNRGESAAASGLFDERWAPR